MTRENIERVRVALEAVNRGGSEAIAGLLDPDVIWIADRSDTGRTTYRGRDGVRRSFAELSEGFKEFGFEPHELIDAGDCIVALGRVYGRGRATGIRAEIPLGIVITLGPDGKVIRYESFRDPTEALEAARGEPSHQRAAAVGDLDEGDVVAAGVEGHLLLAVR